MPPFRSTYRGRFAPSPSGALHLGSLITALGSYLDARADNGHFIIRIEDIDQTRCNQASADLILEDLDALHIYSDEDIIYQSKRHALYESYLQQLIQQGYSYNCHCTRKELKERPCPCKHLQLSSFGANICFKAPTLETSFDDLLQGHVEVKQTDFEHIVLKRKDGSYAYNLVVVVDDIEQNINTIVRGSDLLDLTIIQKAIYKALDCISPSYLHLPLILNSDGSKLSKQNHAPRALSQFTPLQALQYSCRFLLPDVNFVDSHYQSVDDFMDFMLSAYQRNKLRLKSDIAEY